MNVRVCGSVLSPSILDYMYLLCFRCDHACTVIGEKFYIMGGSGGEKLWYNDLHTFDTGIKFLNNKTRVK